VFAKHEGGKMEFDLRPSTFGGEVGEQGEQDAAAESCVLDAVLI
jgi:hypothetical protein